MARAQAIDFDIYDPDDDKRAPRTWKAFGNKKHKLVTARRERDGNKLKFTEDELDILLRDLRGFIKAHRIEQRSTTHLLSLAPTHCIAQTCVTPAAASTPEFTLAMASPNPEFTLSPRNGPASRAAARLLMHSQWAHIRCSPNPTAPVRPAPRLPHGRLS